MTALSPLVEANLASPAATDGLRDSAAELYKLMQSLRRTSPLQRLHTNGFSSQQIWGQLDKHAANFGTYISETLDRLENAPSEKVTTKKALQKTTTAAPAVSNRGDKQEDLSRKRPRQSVDADAQLEKLLEAKMKEFGLTGDEDDEDEGEDEELDDDASGQEDEDMAGLGIRKKKKPAKEAEEEDDEADEEEEGEEGDDAAAAMRELYGDDADGDDFFEEDEDAEGEGAKGKGQLGGRSTLADDYEDDDEDLDAGDDEEAEDDDEAAEEEEDEFNERIPTEELDPLEQQTLALEEKMLQPKHWSDTGEVYANERDENSALDLKLDMEYAEKAPTVYTEEVTAELEKRIKQRILNKDFDDVEPKFAMSSILDLAEAEKKHPWDCNKSENTLIDIYEKEYMDKVKQSMGESTSAEVEKLSVEEKQELNVLHLWRELSSILDAMSNSSTLPAKVADLRIVASENKPAIHMEEITPTAVSQATLLAPTDSYNPRNKLMGDKAKEELTREDRRKIRRVVKTELHKKNLRKEKQHLKFDAKSKADAARKEAEAAANEQKDDGEKKKRRKPMRREHLHVLRGLEEEQLEKRAKRPKTFHEKRRSQGNRKKTSDE
eukprot:TRINITY_DN54700_c0_g1_i1.p1 TRINITY_DN54700_c0_g1~~TRINITY_DN54700_c0_g1_i1.p1  ORF type:complete len:621 (-),score=178.68 TRINITY_DN54700_c0_g1_i1:22-1842(-)